MPDGLTSRDIARAKVATKPAVDNGYNTSVELRPTVRTERGALVCPRGLAGKHAKAVLADSGDASLASGRLLIAKNAVDPKLGHNTLVGLDWAYLDFDTRDKPEGTLVFLRRNGTWSMDPPGRGEVRRIVGRVLAPGKVELAPNVPYFELTPVAAPASVRPATKPRSEDASTADI